MSCCVAHMCSNRQVSSSGLSFFRFPINDKDRLQQWIHNLKRKSWTPNKHSRLCSIHFTQDSFIVGRERVTLKPDAVPTIFYPHLHIKAKVRRSRVSKNTTVRKTDPATQARRRRNVSHDHDYIGCAPSEPQTVAVNVASCSRSHSADHGAYSLKNSPSPLKRKMPLVQSKLLSCKKKMKLQDQTVRRLKEKVKSLSSVDPSSSCSCKKKIKLQERTIRRLKQKVKSLSSVVTDLEEKLRVSNSCGDVLEASFSGVATEIQVILE
ncbi:THAP domain-containing protein 2-like [Sander lucioperca]|uniref:THAP domain-containing protein 2-like n=1 Tax=Sander lucioperca TaxID=283035 RepID=UPI00125DE8DD|nr:THAP domain-containing protein 2-like [Sander lucioperca]